MKTQTIPNKEDAKEIASTIYRQIFSITPELKVSLKHAAFEETGTVQLRFITPKGANHVSVIYDYGADLYNVEIHECRILTRDPYMINNKLNEINGVCFDQLGDIIKKELSI